MAGHLEAARTGDTVYVRVIGLGNFNNAGPLREYCEGAFAEGFHNIIVDLALCTGLDSTFMGTMIGFLSVDIEDSKDIVVTVVNADKENQARFGPFVDALIAEVKKQCESDND